MRIEVFQDVRKEVVLLVVARDKHLGLRSQGCEDVITLASALFFYLKFLSSID